MLWSFERNGTEAGGSSRCSGCWLVGRRRQLSFHVHMLVESAMRMRIMRAWVVVRGGVSKCLKASGISFGNSRWMVRQLMHTARAFFAPSLAP